MIRRQAALEDKKQLARVIAGIAEEQ